jgi:hypothetical protein
MNEEDLFRVTCAAARQIALGAEHDLSGIPESDRRREICLQAFYGIYRHVPDETTLQRAVRLVGLFVEELQNFERDLALRDSTFSKGKRR